MMVFKLLQEGVAHVSSIFEALGNYIVVYSWELSVDYLNNYYKMLEGYEKHEEFESF